MNCRPSKIREKRQAHRDHIAFCKKNGVPNSFNEVSFLANLLYDFAQNELWD